MEINREKMKIKLKRTNAKSKKSEELKRDSEIEKTNA
jgi:hypothetical protein